MPLKPPHIFYFIETHDDFSGEFLEFISCLGATKINSSFIVLSVGNS